MCDLLIDLQAELHGLDPEQLGLADFGKPDGYVERQVRGWIKRYGDAKTDDIAEMRAVADWLLAHMPPSLPGVIIHNDFKFDNVVFRDERYDAIIGVLDWEMATLGDPLMDLGTTLCYWIQADDHPGLQNLKMVPTNIDGMYTRQQLAARYADKTGRDVSNIVFYYIFGLYKTAAVLQQIYLRYKKGLTEDPRFASLIMGVKLLAERAAETVEVQEL
jgi:aminoglycoside phosphotransferase (APT) family kinase protein